MARKKKVESNEEVQESVVENLNEKAVETLEENAEVNEEPAKKRGRKKKEESVEGKVEISGDDIAKKRKEMEERAKKLLEEVGEVKTEELKEKLEQERKTLVPLEDYLKVGVYIGTKVITPHMRQYVFKRRNDGIAIFNVNAIDRKIKEMAKLMAKYAPEDFIVVCKRETGWKAVKKFSEITGVRVFTKKYPAGILTNSRLPNFFETEMVFVCDPWVDKNAMHDGKRVKKIIYGLADTNNYTFNMDYLIPCNNKSGKSLGLIFYILTREYLKARGIEKEIPSMEEFMTEEDLQQ